MSSEPSREAERSALVRSLWWVAAAMTVHEAEEWNIAEWQQRNFVDHTGIPNEAIWLGLVVITALYLLWILLATRLRSPIAIAAVALPAVALVAVGNSVQHITWTFLFAEYAPGVLTAALLVIPTSVVAMWRMVEVDRRFAIPLLACAALWVAASAQIVSAGRMLQPFQHQLQAVVMSLYTALGSPG